MRKLSKYEKETIINWNEAENLASVYNICAAEQLPSAMTYKITRKLEKHVNI